jgi:hypothetical protein
MAAQAANPELDEGLKLLEEGRTTSTTRLCLGRRTTSASSRSNTPRALRISTS